MDIEWSAMRCSCLYWYYWLNFLLLFEESVDRRCSRRLLYLFRTACFREMICAKWYIKTLHFFLLISVNIACEFSDFCLLCLWICSNLSFFVVLLFKIRYEFFLERRNTYYLLFIDIVEQFVKMLFVIRFWS